MLPVPPPRPEPDPDREPEIDPEDYSAADDQRRQDAGERYGEHSRRPPRSRVEVLEDRIEELERQLAASQLHSRSLMTRAFTVWGHFMLAHLTILSPILLLAMCAGLMGSSK